MRFKRAWMSATLALAALGSASLVAAQEPQQPPRPPRPEGPVIEKFEIERMMPAVPEGDVITSVGGGNTFVFVNSEMSFERKTVKGAPYSAEATTEMVQTLGDGNRIVRKNSATIYRDSEGRTRREQTLSAIGQWSAAGEPPKTIFINDPVARVNYILDPKNQTARKLIIPQLPAGATFSRVAPAAAPAPNIRVLENGAPNGDRLERHTPKVESLGKQIIEGVEAEGTRTTITIPAGKIGNERAIDIVTERWYSPELQVVVYSKRSDPMLGETTYRLTNINRTEPARSLFEVPQGYTVKESPSYNFRMRKALEERKAQQ